MLSKIKEQFDFFQFMGVFDNPHELSLFYEFMDKTHTEIKNGIENSITPEEMDKLNFVSNLLKDTLRFIQNYQQNDENIYNLYHNINLRITPIYYADKPLYNLIFNYLKERNINYELADAISNLRHKTQYMILLDFLKLYQKDMDYISDFCLLIGKHFSQINHFGKQIDPEIIQQFINDLSIEKMNEFRKTQELKQISVQYGTKRDILDFIRAKY